MRSQVVSAKIPTTTYDSFPYGFKLSGYVLQTLPVDPNFDGEKGTYIIPRSGNYTISLLSIYSIIGGGPRGDDGSATAKEAAPIRVEEVVTSAILNGEEVLVNSAWEFFPDFFTKISTESKFVNYGGYFEKGEVISTLLVNPMPHLLLGTFFLTIIPS